MMSLLQISENSEMQETILLLRQQLSSKEKNNDERDRVAPCEETCADENTPTSVMSLNRILSLEDSKECSKDAYFNSQIHAQVIPSLSWHLQLWETQYPFSFCSFGFCCLYCYVVTNAVANCFLRLLK